MSNTYPLNWELDSLLPEPSSDEFRAALDEHRAALKDLAQRSESLPGVNGDADNVKVWAAFLSEHGELAARGRDFGAFISCQAAADAECELFMRLEGELAALRPLQEQIATNIEFALKNASDTDLDAFQSADESIGDIAFYLKDCKSRAELRLPKEQESLASQLAVDGVHAWGRLYNRISGKLRIKVMERGEIVEKSVGQVQFDSPQRSVRQNNFYAANKAWSTIADTCADAVNHIAGSRLTIYDRVGLKDHLEAPCRFNRIERPTLDAMWSAVESRRGCLTKYLDKKAEALGLEKIAWYDLLAPYPTQANAANAELPYDDACQMVIDSFGEFSPDFGEFAAHALNNKWVEVENRPGKRQGGFCTGFPTKKESRIFMTYTNSPDSMSVLAHELGHAYHSWVLKDRPFFLRSYPMNLAETASTFAEAVLGERRLQSASDAEQVLILDQMLADAVAFLMNIHARFVFEDRFHLERADGELSADRLSELMLQAQQETHCRALADDGWNPGFWISKLHFYITTYPFYNFPYTFGYLLSLGAYALGSQGADDFPKQYRDLLIATGCQNAEDAVQSTLGYDLRDETFWNKSLDIVEQRVERFLEIA